MLTGRVIFTVFAGRRRFMHILMAYVQPLLQEGVVDEVHVWDYCKVAADREYLKGLTISSTAGLRIMTPPPSDLTAKFPHYVWVKVCTFITHPHSRPRHH